MDEYLRLLREGFGRLEQMQQPTVRPNRTLLSFQNNGELVVLNEQLTVQATGLKAVAEWGPTTKGPGGGNWQWNGFVWG